MNIDWKRKITSRKLWMALAGFISGLLIALKVDAKTAETISGLVLSAGSVIAYIIGEGLADAANAGGIVLMPGDDEVPTVNHPPEEEDLEDG